jgi:hypothetical protein
LSTQQTSSVGDLLSAGCLISPVSDPILPTQYLTKLLPEAFAADGVDEGVVAAVAHGQPVGDQEDKVNVLEIVNPGVTEENNEIYLVWEPAEAEDDDNSDQHKNHPLLVFQDPLVLGMSTFSRCNRLPQAERNTNVGIAHRKEREDVLNDDQKNVVEIEDLHL